MKILVPMCADIIHHGHINIITKVSELGEVTIGLSTDRFIKELKGKDPILTYDLRKIIVMSIKGVTDVIEMDGLDIPPGFGAVAHGDDWDPKYNLNGAIYIRVPSTKDVSSAIIKNMIAERNDRSSLSTVF
jgi:phosphoenolpyruvate phosphomutase